MYKKAMTGLMMVNLLVLVSFGCVKGLQYHKEMTSPAFQMRLDRAWVADSKSSTMGMVSAAASGQRVVDFGTMEQEGYQYRLSQEDYEALLRIVEAEAGGEDEEGRLLVANVVLNRVNSEDFPDSVTEVVMQRDKGVSQFSPVSNGRYWTVEVSEKTISAVERALEGEDISEGALYFAARKYADSGRMRWFDENLTFLFQHGGHEFFY